MSRRAGPRRRGAGSWIAAGVAIACAAPLAAGAAARLLYAARTFEVWLPHVNRWEGYYEGAINFLCYRVMGLALPSFQPGAGRGPLFPSFLAAVESFFENPAPGHVRAAQAVLSLLGLACVFELGRGLVSPWAGVLAAAWLALDAPHVLSMGELDITFFYSMTLLALAAAAARWAESPTPARSALLGLVLGASLLCRSAHFAFPLLLCLACLTLWRKAGPRLRDGLLVALLAGLCAAPYAVRNLLHFGRATPGDVLTGSYRLFAAARGEADCCDAGTIQRFRAAVAAAPGAGDCGPPEDLERALLGESRRLILRHPLRYAATAARISWNFWSPHGLELAAGLGTLLLFPRRRAFHGLWLVAASFAGTNVIATSPDHGLALRPLLGLLAGLGLACATLSVPRRLPLAAAFFREPAPGAPATSALLALLAASYLATLAVLAAEFTPMAVPRPLEAASLDNPRHRRAIRLLDLSVARSGGRYGLEERARLLMSLGHARAAERDLERLRLASPADRSELWLDLARAAVQSGEPDLARRALGRARRADPARRLDGLSPVPDGATAEFWMLRAAALDAAGRRAQARLSLAAALAAGPTDSQRHRVALLYQDMRLYPEAARLLEELSARFPGSAKYRSDRAMVSYLEGRPDEAVRRLRRALRVDPGLLPASLTLGAILTEQGRLREALAVYDAGLRSRVRGPDLPDYAALSAARRHLAGRLAAGREP